MAHAWTHRSARHLHAGVPRADAQGGCAVRAECGVEGHLVLRLHSGCDCRLRGSFWSLRSGRPTRSDDHPDSSAPGLLLFVAVCFVVVPAPISRDAHSPDWSRHRHHCPPGASVCSRRRREELEAQANCGAHDTSGRSCSRHTDSFS